MKSAVFWPHISIIETLSVISAAAYRLLSLGLNEEAISPSPTVMANLGVSAQLDTTFEITYG
jgi:hypothetical protein